MVRRGAAPGPQGLLLAEHLQGAAGEPSRIGVVGAEEQPAGPQQGAGRGDQGLPHLGAHPARHPMGHHDVVGLRPATGRTAGGEALGEGAQVRQGVGHVLHAEVPCPGGGLGDVGRIQVDTVKAGLGVGNGIEEKIQAGPAAEFQVAEPGGEEARIEAVAPPQQGGQHEPGHRQFTVGEGRIDLFGGIGRPWLHAGMASRAEPKGTGAGLRARPAAGTTIPTGTIAEARALTQGFSRQPGETRKKPSRRGCSFIAIVHLSLANPPGCSSAGLHECWVTAPSLKLR